jgi:Holliday junction resolvase
MKRTPQADSRLEELVARRYREAGYEVIHNPTPALIPFDLGGYRPDILARKDGLNLIIEVKHSFFHETASYERLRGVVEETRLHEGWRFVLVTERDVAESNLPDDSNQPSWEEIEDGMRNADKFGLMSEHQAAYLLLWIAFEQTIRKLSIEAGLPLDRLAPAIMIRQLYSEGVLSMEQFDAALSCLQVRNLVVHGFRRADLAGEYELLRGVLAGLLPKRS